MIKKYISLLISLVLIALLAACSSKVPESWEKIGIPKNGLTTVLSKTDDNGFYGDYTGISAKELMDLVEKNVINKGFSKICTVFDGYVRGFERDSNRLVVKVDTFGDVVSLSAFNEKGIDPVLFEACFNYNTIHIIESDK